MSHSEVGAISLPVGSYDKAGETKKRYRRIGVLMKTEHGSGEEHFWIKLNGDALSSSLLIFAKGQMDKGESEVLCSVFAKRADE